MPENNREQSLGSPKGSGTRGTGRIWRRGAPTVLHTGCQVEKYLRGKCRHRGPVRGPTGMSQAEISGWLQWAGEKGLASRYTLKEQQQEGLS